MSLQRIKLDLLVLIEDMRRQQVSQSHAKKFNDIILSITEKDDPRLVPEHIRTHLLRIIEEALNLVEKDAASRRQRLRQIRSMLGIRHASPLSGGSSQAAGRRSQQDAMPDRTPGSQGGGRTQKARKQTQDPDRRSQQAAMLDQAPTRQGGGRMAAQKAGQKINHAALLRQILTSQKRRMAAQKAKDNNP